ncbi:hypothetical protein Tco_0807709 [Tanacetum coccineum]
MTKETSRLKKLWKSIQVEEEVAIVLFFAANPKEDLETLYKLVKAKYKSTRPVEDLDLVLWNDLKTMFEPTCRRCSMEESTDYKVLSWKFMTNPISTFLRSNMSDLYVGREEVLSYCRSTYTIYTYNDVGKEAYD